MSTFRTNTLTQHKTGVDTRHNQGVKIYTMDQNERAGCLGRILQALGLASKPPAKELKLPYRLRDDFLSPAELNFYRVLQAAVGDWAVICPKIRLGDLFYPKTGDRSQNATWRNKIAQKHVDFVLCHPRTMRPLVGVELDDKSHQRPDRQERDRFVERVFAAAELPLHRVPAQSSYNTHQLTATLRQKVGIQEHDGAQPAPPIGAARPAPATTLPPCPKCGRPMVLRTAKREGPHKGKKFWGCPDFPRCRGVREHLPEGENARSSI